MEQRKATGKDHQRTVAQKHPDRRQRIAWMRSGRAAVSPLRVDLASADEPERDQRGEAKCGGDEEDGLVRDQVTGSSHSDRSEACANGSETGVAAESLGHGGMADQSEADRSDRRPKNAARSRVQELRRQHN